MKTVIAGGRAYWPTKDEEAELLKLKDVIPITEVISGCAAGVDTFAIWWAARNGLAITKLRGAWNNFKKSAGMLRNKEMLKLAECAVFFSGGIGTQDMIRLAVGKNIPIYYIGKCYAGKQNGIPFPQTETTKTDC